MPYIVAVSEQVIFKQANNLQIPKVVVNTNPKKMLKYFKLILRSARCELLIIAFNCIPSIFDKHEIYVYVIESISSE